MKKRNNIVRIILAISISLFLTVQNQIVKINNKLPDCLGKQNENIFREGTDNENGSSIVKLEIPTVLGEAGKAVEKGIITHRPDVVICVGQAGRRADIEVERIAINLSEAPILDNAGNQPMDEKVQEDGDTAYFATVPTKAMVKSINAHGIPASVSYTAGTYVCNSIRVCIGSRCRNRCKNSYGNYRLTNRERNSKGIKHERNQSKLSKHRTDSEYRNT